MRSNDTDTKLAHPMPELDPSIELVNDNTPQISRMQIDLLVNALANDMTRVATLQYMRSVGQAQMRWLGIEEGHHSLSHEPDNNKAAYEKLQKINTWFAGELAYLAKRLAETPEPTGDGSMLDHTLHRLDQRTRQGQLAHARQHPVRAASAAAPASRWAAASSSTRSRTTASG